MYAFMRAGMRFMHGRIAFIHAHMHSCICPSVVLCVYLQNMHACVHVGVYCVYTCNARTQSCAHVRIAQRGRMHAVQCMFAPFVRMYARMRTDNVCEHGCDELQMCVT